MWKYDLICLFLHVNCIGKEAEKFNHASVFSLLNNPGLILMTSITISKPIFSYRHVFLFLLFLSINSILNKFTTRAQWKMKPSSQILINDHIKNLSAGQTDTHHVPQTDPNWFSTIYNHCMTFCMVEKLFKMFYQE